MEFIKPVIHDSDNMIAIKVYKNKEINHILLFEKQTSHIFFRYRDKYFLSESIHHAFVINMTYKRLSKFLFTILTEAQNNAI